MSNRDTGEQLGLRPPASLFPLSSGSPFSTGFSLSSLLTEPSTQSLHQPSQVFKGTQAHAAQPQLTPVGPDAIEFRVTRDGTPSRRLRLSGRRYTFGSGEGCSIRLADATLRPMHAVLIRDAHRVLIRAYSVPISVNGNRTTEAVLSVGDSLQLGSYHLEMLGSEFDSRSNATTDTSATDSDCSDAKWNENAVKLRFADGPTMSSSRSSLSRLGREANDRASSLAAEDSVWREQLRREVEQWRMAKAECERRESRCDDRETNMRERESELWNRSELLWRRESELKAQESAILEIQQEYELKKQSLARLQAEDRNRRDEFQRREAEFLRLEKEYREQIEQVTQQLQRSQDQASIANETVQRMREQFATLNGQLAELTAKQSELNAQNKSQSEELRRAQQELQHVRDQAVHEQDLAIAGREELASQARELASQLDSAFAQLEGAVAQREAALADRLQAIRDRDEAENQAVQAIRSREESVGQRNLAQRERDSAIDARSQSDALRIKLTAELAQAAERLVDVESELAESRRLIEQSEHLNDSWKEQVLELQASVVSAKNETHLLRIDYEAACESITKLETLVKEQSRHSRESKDSWVLEAEHLRRSFEAVSRDLAVALGELSQLQDANTEFASQLESVRADKERVESELASRPTQDAWNEKQAELEQASVSLQIIQRDYNATLTELNHLRGELQDERSWTDEQLTNKVVDASSPEVEVADSPSAAANVAADLQWSQDSEDVWPSYAASTATPNGISSNPISEIKDRADSDSAAMGWSTPIYPVKAPEAEIHDPIVDETPSPNADSRSQAVRWSTVNTDEKTETSVSSTSRIEDGDEGFGSLAQRLIADLERDNSRSDNEHIEDELQDEDEENEAFFEATALHSGIIGPTSFDKAEAQEELAESNPWNVHEDHDDYVATEVRGELGLGFGTPHFDVDENQESEPTSLWSQALYGADSNDETSKDDRYNGASTYDRVASEESNTYPTDIDLRAASEDDRADSQVWTSGSDSVVMDSELVASDNHEDIRSNRALPTRETISTPAPTRQPVEQTFEDDSIEAYMNRLLQRVQGSSSSSGDLSASQPVSMTAVTVANEPVKSNPSRLPADENPSNNDPNSPMMPRSQAPEKNGSLSAMRQLANESARTAIHRSVKIQSRDTQLKAFVKFASAIGLVCCALAVILFTHFPGTTIIACCMCVVSFVWVNEGIKLLGVARRRLALAAAGKLEQDEADEAKAGADEALSNSAHPNKANIDANQNSSVRT